MKKAAFALIVAGTAALMTASAARAGDDPVIPTCFLSNNDAECSVLLPTSCGEWKCVENSSPIAPHRGSPDGICTLLPVNDARECRGTGGNVCDVAEQCDGSDLFCPIDTFASPETSCSAGTAPAGFGRIAVDECDPGDTCDGSGTCVDNTLIDGTTCNDFNGCTQTDTCQTGACTGSNPVVCTALDQCHDAGTCDPQTGACDDPAKTDGASCDDSNACTTTDTCESGVCTGTGCPVCGNGIVEVEAGEQCDDSNTDPGDGCDASCQLEDVACLTDDDCADSSACADIRCNVQTGFIGFCELTYLTSECRPAANDCDAAELCDGASLDCPADAPATEGTPCGDTDPLGACDEGDTCDDAGNCQENLLDSSTECRADAGACDVAENCDGASADCPTDLFEPVDTPCGDPGTGDCTEPDTCAGDSNTCLPNHLECGLVTGGGNCLFDKYPGRGNCSGGSEDCTPCAVGDPESACVLGGGSCDETRDFRLIFTPDVKLWPAHKLNATNSGQHRYNLFVEGTAGEEQTVTIELPFPFVTQGANPVHAWDAFTSGQDGECFAPSDEVTVSQAWVALADWSDGTQGGPGNLNCDAACGPLTCGTEATCTFDVTFTVPESGMTYVQVHLDYGLKGVSTDGNPCDALADRYDPAATNSVGGRDALENNATQDGEVRIADGQAYDFAHFVGSDPEGGDTVRSANEFKRIAGVLGLAAKSADGSGVAGATVELVRAGKIVSRTTTDADGFFALTYKHKGKTTTYTVRFRGEQTLSQQIQLKANGWAEVNFDLSTASASAQFGGGAK